MGDITRAIVKHSNWDNRRYQGVVDVTEHMDFQGIATHCDLTNRQYDQLINQTQKQVDKVLSGIEKGE
jgi:hypothetical protein